MAFSLSLVGIVMAAGLEALLLFLGAASFGALVPIIVTVVLLFILDFLFLRNGPIILGQMIGVLGTTGVYYLILLILGKVH